MHKEFFPFATSLWESMRKEELLDQVVPYTATEVLFIVILFLVGTPALWIPLSSEVFYSLMYILFFRTSSVYGYF